MNRRRDALSALWALNRQEVSRGVRVGARDAALLVLYAAGISPEEISRLDSGDVVVDHSGVMVRIVDPDDGLDCPRFVLANPAPTTRAYVSQLLRDHLAANNCAAMQKPLFTGLAGRLSPGAITKILTRRMRQVNG